MVFADSIPVRALIVFSLIHVQIRTNIRNSQSRRFFLKLMMERIMTEEGESDSSITADNSQDIAFEVSSLIKQRLAKIKDLLYESKPHKANPDYLREVLSSITEINGVVSKAIDLRVSALKDIVTDEEIDRVKENLRPLSQDLNDALMETSAGLYEIT